MSIVRRIVRAYRWATRGFLGGDWIPVFSSWILAARYDPLLRILYIRTKQGREYPWAQGIDREKARSFFRVSSQGKWIWRNYPPRMGLKRFRPGDIKPGSASRRRR